MKTSIKTTGIVELNDQELLQAIRDYAKKKKDIVLHAVNDYMATYHRLQVKKVQYSDLNRVVATVESEVNDDISTFADIKEPIKRTKKRPHARPNTGLYNYMLEYLLEAKSKNEGKPTIVQYDKFCVDIKKEYPKVKVDNLYIYIYDEKFTSRNIFFDSKTRTISVR